MTNEERENVKIEIEKVKGFIKDFKEAGVQINTITYLEWIGNIEQKLCTQTSQDTSRKVVTTAP